MALLKNVYTGETIVLQSQHVFGRNPTTSNTPISEKDVSQSHAIISWDNGSWSIHDHSRNGTLIGNNYIHHAAAELKDQDLLQFGKSEKTLWEVLNLLPPMNYLKCLESGKFCELGADVSKESVDVPEVSFFYTPEGQWYVEMNKKQQALLNGLKMNLGDETWEYVENEALDETVDNHQLINQSYFQFVLSPDEEHIFLMLFINQLKFELGERTYNNLLLALARKRLEDHVNGYQFDDQGWIGIEEVINHISKEMMKEVDQYYVNVQIHRLRKQLIKLKPYGYLLSGIVERRMGEVRFAHKYFQIMKEKEILGEILMENRLS